MNFFFRNSAKIGKNCFSNFNKKNYSHSFQKSRFRISNEMHFKLKEFLIKIK